MTKISVRDKTMMKPTVYLKQSLMILYKTSETIQYVVLTYR